jgi:hypothetical protein
MKWGRKMGQAKKLTSALVRHLDTVDVQVQLADGTVVKGKGDVPSRMGIHRDAPAAATRLAGFVRNANRVWLYASTDGVYERKADLVGVRPTPARARMGLVHVVEHLAKLSAYQLTDDPTTGTYEEPRIVLVSNLRPMYRGQEDNLALGQLKKDLGPDPTSAQKEAAIVAYILAGQFKDPQTEGADAIGTRYMNHVVFTGTHLDDLPPGQEGTVLSMTHEPGLSVVLAKYFGERYLTEIAPLGAVPTGQHILFTLEQPAPGKDATMKVEYTVGERTYETTRTLNMTRK